MARLLENKAEVLSRMTHLELAGPVERVRSTFMNGHPLDACALHCRGGRAPLRLSGSRPHRRWGTRRQLS